MIRSTRDARAVAVRVGLLTMLGLVLGLSFGLGPASAHPLLISSSPEDGAVVATSPTSIALRFHDEVGELADVSVWAPDGSVVTRREITTDFDTIIATFESSDQRGRYTAY